MPWDPAWLSLTYAEFKRTWLPSEFCELSLNMRTTIHLGWLASSDPVLFIQVDGRSKLAIEHTPIHGAMPLLFDYMNNKQIAWEACNVFFRYNTYNTFILSSRCLQHVLLDQTDTLIKHQTIQPRLLFRNLRILLEHREPQTLDDSTSVELVNLLDCQHLDRLDIEMRIPDYLANEPGIIRIWVFNKAVGLGCVIRQLRGRFGSAVKVVIGGPIGIEEKEDITWVCDRPSSEL